MFSFIKKINWDAMGIITSVACAIHCAILPLLLTSLPLFGINIINNSFFEWSMIGIAFLVGSYALSHGYKRHHRNWKPLIIFSVGFIFLILKQIFYTYEFVFLVPAVCCILYAHFLNYRYCGVSRTCSTHSH
ncbi:MAG: MerC domain-containing protein [Bacteroidota bacterium]|nr:MerC domain-containing protein [Bacteroidota bacterium]